MNTKIAIILGRGIEGCGVTRAAINMYNYFEKKGYYVKGYASNDKKRGRRKNQQHKFEEFSNIEIMGLSKKLEDFDIIYYHSLPSKSHSEEYCKLFEKYFVDNITKPFKVMIQHDHKIQSLNRNYKIRDITRKMDLIFNFDISSKFSIYARGLGVEVKTMHNGFDFDFYKKFRKEERIKRITYFGRFATFKDPIRLIFMHPLLKEKGFITEMRGIERSLGALPIFYKDVKAKEKEYRDNIELDNEAIQTIEKVHIYGPYIYEEGLEELSNSMFGANFYNITQGTGTHIEFSTLEIIACGLIPVVDENRAKVAGYYNDNSFIYCDKDNYEECVEIMEKVSKNKEIYNERWQNCLKIVKNRFSFDKAFDKIYTDTLSSIK